MAIASNLTTGPYTANGTQTAFAFTFTVVSPADVQVQIGGVVQSSSLYTVSVNADGTGTVTFSTPPANGASVLLVSNPDFAQETVFESEGVYSLAQVNTVNRRDAVRTNWLAGIVRRLIPAGWATPSNLAGKFLAFDAGGNPVVASGTGADGALRSDLATSGGSALAGFLQSGAGAVARTVQDELRDYVNVKQFGAVGGGVANDSAAFQVAINRGVPFIVPPNTYKQDTALTGNYRAILIGATCTGANAMDALYPAFGSGVLKIMSRGTSNCFIGMADNNAAGGTVAFPVGVTGYGRVSGNGNQVFGLFGRADLYATGGGVATNEVNCFNYAGTPSTAFPPQLGFGTTERSPIGLIVAAGGTSNSHIGVYIAREGEAPQAFRCGIYTDPQAVTDYGLLIDATSTNGPTLPALIKHRVSVIGVQVQGVGTPVAGNTWLSYVNGSAVETFAVQQDGKIKINGTLVLGNRDTGWTAMTGTPDKSTAYATGTVTLAQLAGRVASLQAALTAHGIIGA